MVRQSPDLQGAKLGTVAAHTIVGWKSWTRAPGCEKRWIEIEPRGWVCESYLQPLSQNPTGSELPKMSVGKRVPGVYAKVIGEMPMVVTLKGDTVISESPIQGTSTVRRRGLITAGGKRYWKISKNKAIAETFLRTHKPSAFEGVRLEDFGDQEESLGFAFVVSSDRPGDWIPILRHPRGGRVRRLAPRSLVSLLSEERTADGTIIAFQIAKGEYIAASHVRQIVTPPPPPRTRATERWFDIDLDSQVLIAYEGTTAVYATLISSGTRKNPTETGIFRIRIKFAETSMSGRMGETDAYSVATVPWTQFYENDFALHTSYWHDKFGQQRSHGCINLSPSDARFLYFWSKPAVPVGWSMANATASDPGSMVRVHSRRDPSPTFKGMALVVQQSRAAQGNN